MFFADACCGPSFVLTFLLWHFCCGCSSSRLEAFGHKFKEQLGRNVSGRHLHLLSAIGFQVLEEECNIYELGHRNLQDEQRDQAAVVRLMP